MADSVTVTLREARPDELGLLLDLWLRSVRATHRFLTEDDIQSLLPIVRDQALPALELWVACAPDGTVVGFMGLAGSSVEAVFIHPDFLRRGAGRRFLDHARGLKGPLTVDVNEQNPEAVRFYEACGFVVVGRSPLDAGGRPFPLLHMRDTRAGGDAVAGTS